MKKNILFIASFALATLLMSCEWLTGGHTEKPTVDNNFVEVKAKYLVGDYYGDISNNVRFYLSDNIIDSDGTLKPHSQYYIIEITAEINDTHNDTVQIPRGSYDISLENSKLAYTNYAGVIYNEESFDSASLYVDFNGISFEAWIGDVRHVVTYSGSPRVRNMGTNGKHSTLADDRALNFNNHTLYYYHCGDYYGTGINNTFLFLWPNSGTGNAVQFDIMTTAEPNDSIYGEYKVGVSDQEWRFLKGALTIEEEQSYMDGSWYYTTDYTDIAPFISGKLEISENEDGTTKLKFNMQDDRYNNITGEWNGTMEAYPI